MKHPPKLDFPVSKVRRYLEPGPIVLVSSRCEGKHNIMTLGWHTILEFTPSLVGCMISGGNHSFEMIRKSRECVINLPTTALTDTVVRIGNTTGANIDKFAEFGLTGEQAHSVEARRSGWRSWAATCVAAVNEIAARNSRRRTSSIFELPYGLRSNSPLHAIQHACNLWARRGSKRCRKRKSGAGPCSRLALRLDCQPFCRHSQVRRAGRRYGAWRVT